jgi:hypothetical protein
VTTDEGSICIKMSSSTNRLNVTPTVTTLAVIKTAPRRRDSRTQAPQEEG